MATYSIFARFEIAPREESLQSVSLEHSSASLAKVSTKLLFIVALIVNDCTRSFLLAIPEHCLGTHENHVPYLVAKDHRVLLVSHIGVVLFTQRSIGNCPIIASAKVRRSTCVIPMVRLIL